jgi:acyl dehydratase
MSLDHLVGTAFGPIGMRISPEKTAEYVAVTRADPLRWSDHAPPSYAGALLFAVAPEFLSRDDVVAYTRVLIHADQHFTWFAPLPVGAEIEVTGSVARVRARGPVSFVSFEATVTGPDGALIESVSTFLLGREAAAEPGNRAEPAVADGVEWPPVTPADAAARAALTRGASRIDLVRYAAASGDFNPIHFDHDAARRAGVDGIVVHGLLMTAWMLDYAAAASDRPDPLATAKVRYRDPLYPAEMALLTGSRREAPAEGATAIDVELACAERRLATAQVMVRR